MKILFVCKHNRFRSKVAEAILKKLNKNVEIESAGLVLDEARPYVAENVIKIMKEKGYSISGKPEQLTREMTKDTDILIIVAKDIDREFFYDFKGKMIKINVEDAGENESEKIMGIIDEIEKEVKNINKDLKNKV